ncbi:hypothetical protein VTH06DRAFT_6281 [Thermothelomyces fergusii]
MDDIRGEQQQPFEPFPASAATGEHPLEQHHRCFAKTKVGGSGVSLGPGFEQRISEGLLPNKSRLERFVLLHQGSDELIAIYSPSGTVD